MNKAIICGSLGADPELRYTQAQKAVATFNVATSHGTKEKKETEWHKVVCWEALAENCAKYLAKGKRVLVEGRIQTRSYEDKDGVKRYAVEIIASNVEFLSPASDGGGKQDAKPYDPTGGVAAQNPLDDIPF